MKKENRENKQKNKKKEVKKENVIKKYIKESFEDYDRGEIAEIVLRSLLAIGMTAVFMALPGVAHIFTLFKPKNNYERKRLKQTVDRLEKGGYIEKVRNKKGIEKIKITQKGKRKVLQYDFIKMELKIPKKWDGLWRMVIFDIPEDRKKVRDAISFKLKNLGFEPLQKSVFVFPYECRDEIDFVGEFFYARKYLRYLEIKHISMMTKNLRKSLAYFKYPLLGVQINFEMSHSNGLKYG